MRGPSERVRQALSAGYSSACAGFAAVCSFGYEHRGREHHQLKVYAGDRLVEVYVSSTGRSVRVWVDGEEVPSWFADEARAARRG